jgi:hypothetical protein
MRTHGRRNIAGPLGVIALVLLLIAGIVAYFIVDAKDRASQLEDYKSDLAAVGFVNTSPKWEDETSGTGSSAKTESSLEANVTVAGCDVELERERGEEDTPKTVGGREIERYEADEVNYRGREIEIDGVLLSSPDAKEIREYLAANAGRFPCYTADAA